MIAKRCGAGYHAAADTVSSTELGVVRIGRDFCMRAAEPAKEGDHFNWETWNEGREAPGLSAKINSKRHGRRNAYPPSGAAPVTQNARSTLIDSFTLAAGLKFLKQLPHAPDLIDSRIQFSDLPDRGLFPSR